MRPGTVYLVGAGPGDPALLTVRAAELLRDADVIAYDALISDGVLAMAGGRAELISVGHRGKGSSRAPYRIHPSVIAEAQAGRSVVRLKSGDPFIFGRGGEEAEELLAAGIPYEIVPGVSAALGAAAYAGIPLTHRDCASDVTFATGHDLLTGAESGSEWARLARGRGTIVLFMASKKLAENLGRLVQGGRAPSTPAAYVARATGARQRTIVGTLADLVEKTAAVDREAPALVIVGEVVALRATLAWREGRPLDGRRVLVARAGRARPSWRRSCARSAPRWSRRPASRTCRSTSRKRSTRRSGD
jgi:uroporphyrin-III C-methyltransferase